MPTPGLHYGFETGALTLNGVLMHCPAWNALDLMTLWPGLDRQVRYGNSVIPGVAGRTAHPVRLDEAKKTLQFAVTGRVDRNGTPAPGGDFFEQLLDNLQYLRDNVINPPSAPTATIPAVLVMPDSATLSAAVQIIGWNLGTHIAAQTMRATMDLVIPAGEFSETIGS